MSLPWLLIVAWPGLAQRLPRPGRWMNHLRVVLGLMMLGSALWLVSLLTIHIGRTPVLTLLVMLAIALLVATAWRYRWRTALRAGALAIVVAGAVAFVAQQDGQGPRRAGLTGSRSASRLSPAPWRSINGYLLMSPPTGA